MDPTTMEANKISVETKSIKKSYPVVIPISTPTVPKASGDQQSSYRSVTSVDHVQGGSLLFATAIVEAASAPKSEATTIFLENHHNNFDNKQNHETMEGQAEIMASGSTFAGSKAELAQIVSDTSNSNFHVVTPSSGGDLLNTFNCGLPDAILRHGTLLHPPASQLQQQEKSSFNSIFVERSLDGNLTSSTNSFPNSSLTYEQSDSLNQAEYFEEQVDDIGFAIILNQNEIQEPSSLISSPFSRLEQYANPGKVKNPPSTLAENSPFDPSKEYIRYDSDPLMSIPAPPPNQPPMVPEASPSSLSSQAESFDQRNRPVLYSAIGSLEDPNSSSFRGWKNRVLNNTVKRPEFPSSQLYLLPSNQLRHSPFDDATTPAISNQRKKAISKQLSEALNAPGTSQQENTISSDQKQEKRQESIAAVPSMNQDAKKQPSSLRNGNFSTENTKENNNNKVNKKVTITDTDPKRKKSKKKQVVEMFRPSSDAYTPRMGKKEIKYKPAEQRTPVQQMASPLGTLSRPNFRDALRRVSMIIHQHIVKIEKRFEQNYAKESQTKIISSPSQSPRCTYQKQRRENDGLFHQAMKDEFSEDKFITPKYKCTMVRIPMARMGMVCGLKRIRMKYEIPSEAEIYEFAHQLFKKVQLSSECSIVCLIYVERLMEVSKVPLLANTWRPIFMCGLLLASKVWQDLSSWNIEFASVYPQYSLDAINRLELQFLRSIKWELYISSSLYAKYFFALRSLVEKTDFRQRYNRMVGGVNNVKASTARKIEERSTMVKEEVLQQLSRSM